MNLGPVQQSPTTAPSPSASEGDALRLRLVIARQRRAIRLLMASVLCLGFVNLLHVFSWLDRLGVLEGVLAWINK